MIDKLIIMCDKQLKINENNILKYTRYEYIRNLLNDREIFKNISIEEAYTIFRDLGIEKNEYANVYKTIMMEY